MQNYQANTAYKSSTTLPLLNDVPAAIGTFPISQTLATQSTGVGTWPQVSRPTLTGGVAGGRIAGMIELRRGYTVNGPCSRPPHRLTRANDERDRGNIESGR